MNTPAPENAAVLLAFARALRARQGELLATHGLHPGQDALLIQVWDSPGISPSVLADRLGVEAPTVTRMLHRLERVGLLEHRADADDRRRIHIHPTPRSRLLEAAVRRCWSDLGDEIGSALAGDTAEEFARLAARITDVLNQKAPRR